MTQDELLDERWNVDFGVAKSMRYHAYRRAFWEGADYWFKIITILAGTGVVVTLLNGHQLAGYFLAFAVAAFSATDIVLCFSARARRHDELYRRFCTLRVDITGTLVPTEHEISQWQSRRLEIEMDEPGTMDWLERRCSAEEALSRGVKPRPSWILSPTKILVSQFVFWPSVTGNPIPETPPKA